MGRGSGVRTKTHKNTVGFEKACKLNISKILICLTSENIYLPSLYMYADATTSKKYSPASHGRP
jgi:hypothetical protein